MVVRRRVIGLSRDGKLALKSADGTEQLLPGPQHHSVAFLLLDCSASMSHDNRLRQAIEGAEGFLRSAISRGYEIGLVRFDSVAELLHAPTSDVELLEASLVLLTAGSSTNMTGAIELGTAHLARARGSDRALVLVTDGIPDEPESALSAARGAAEDGIQIIAIGTDGADSEFLRRIATSDDLAFKVQAKQLGTTISSAARLLPGSK